MNVGLFLLYTSAGTAVWSALLAWAGLVLRENYSLVEGYLAPFGYAVIGLVLLWFLLRAARRWRATGRVL